MLKRIFLIVFLYFLLPSPAVLAQEGITEKTFEARVVEILDEKEVTFEGQKHTYQKVILKVLTGELAGRSVIVESGQVASSYSPTYKIGDRVMVLETEIAGEGTTYHITDYVRRDALLSLFLLFCIVSIAIGRRAGLASLIGMSFSFLVIFKLVIPMIMNGENPVLSAIAGAFLIVPVSFTLSHGVNRKTLVAMVGTVISLIVTGVLAVYFVNLAKLSGFASEEAGFLSFEREDINIKGLLLAGIIIGTLGVLDDITVSQASVVRELREASPKIKVGKLFSSAMEVGRDHIASLVNTLVLVYTGASLPLLLLFVNNPLPFSEVINYEILADEIIRTLVGSIGLILAVPITTLLAVRFVGRTK